LQDGSVHASFLQSAQSGKKGEIMEKLEKKLSEMELLSRGYWGNIYVYSDGLILKTSPKYTREMIEGEFLRARQVFEAGIPCVEPVKMLETEDGPAIVYERIEGSSIARRASKHLEDLDTYLDAYVKLCKKMWADRFEAGAVPTIKSEFRHVREGLLELADRETVERFFGFIEALPDWERFLHMDLHWCNVMYNGGDCKLIDMPYVAVGHPAFDMASLAYAYYLILDYPFPDSFQSVLRLTTDEAAYVWKGFCDRIFSDLPEETKAERKDLVERLSKAVFVKDFMQDVLLGVASEGDKKLIVKHLESFVSEDLEFAQRVLREWKV